MAALSLIASVALGYPTYPALMPNAAVYFAAGTPALGHTDEKNGGGPNNAFGTAFGATGVPPTWTLEFCNADTDGDGQTNGLEMGDPCCEWTKGGTPFVATQISNPSDKASTTSRVCPTKSLATCSLTPPPTPAANVTTAPTPAAAPAPAWPGLPETLSVSSVSIVVIAVGALFAAPSALAVCWAPSSYRVQLLLSLLVAVVCTLAGTGGVLDFLGSSYGGADVPYPLFTSTQFYGLVAGMILLPIAAIAIVTFSLHFSKLGNGEESAAGPRFLRALWPRRLLQILAFSGLALFFGWAAVYAAFDWGWDIVRCGVIGCVVDGLPPAADATRATAFRNVAGLWLAVVCACLSAAHAVLALRCLARAAFPGIYSSPSGEVLERERASVLAEVTDLDDGPAPADATMQDGLEAELLQQTTRGSAYSLNARDGDDDGASRPYVCLQRPESIIDGALGRAVYSKCFGKMNDDVLCGCCCGQYGAPIALVLLFCVGLPLLFVCTLALPTTWQHWTSVNGLLPGQVARPVGAAGSAQSGEHANALFKTFDVKTAWGKSAVYLKAYPDTIIFFAMIYVVSALALLARFVPAVRRLLRVQFKVPFVAKARSLRIPVCRNVCVCCGRTDRATNTHYIYPFSGNFFASTIASVGQLCFGAIVACFVAAWIVYWAHDHKYHQGEEKIAAEIFARVLGQLSNLILGLLLLPVSRNSIWTHIFGIPWEAAIATHVFLGYAFLAIGLLHMCVVVVLGALFCVCVCLFSRRRRPPCSHTRTHHRAAVFAPPSQVLLLGDLLSRRRLPGRIARVVPEVLVSPRRFLRPLYVQRR